MKAQDAIKELEENKKNIRFKRLITICESFFVGPRIKGSHHIYKTPWKGDPRLNLQKDGNKAKAYQVEQLIEALKKLVAEGKA